MRKFFFGFFFVIFLFCHSQGFAQEAARLIKFSIQENDASLVVVLEHASPPLNVLSQDFPKENMVLFTLVGSRIAFQKYDNIPIEIPVKKQGVVRLVIREMRIYREQQVNTVEIRAEFDRPVVYTMDSQWNGQFVQLTFVPQAAAATVDVERKEAIAGSDSLRRIKEFKTIESLQAEQKLKQFSDTKRLEVARKESKERLSRIRSDAKKRLDEGISLEKAYEKLKEDTSFSKIPAVRQEI
ncbi:MAG: hypothetical protein NC924_06995, partial [Candidatus Omnitrophica bacterium]|nr:hypothetical protein [Candidatus Omnitrophota bacterium]